MVKVKGDIRVKNGEWRNLIRRVIQENFSNSNFCIYDVASKIINRKAVVDKNEFYKWLMRVRSVIVEMENNGEVVFVGWEEGRAPIKRKVYRLVRQNV